MVSQSAPFPVKPRIRTIGSTKEAAKVPGTNFKTGLPSPKEKTVFGTARNPNIPSKKPAPEKNNKKPSQPRLLKKPPLLLASKKNASSSKNGVSKKDDKKSGVCCIQENLKSGDGIHHPEPSMPIRVARLKPKVAATPYLSAERCSKCRFDKLQTSCYWLGQIEIAESVGKHFVSAAFFGLALECQAEPMSSIKTELKKYVGRHKYLNEEEGWKKLLHSYGLPHKEQEEEC